MNESPTQSATEEAGDSSNTAASPTETVEGARAEQDLGVGGEGAAQAPGATLIAPDVPRLGRPVGTAKAIPETILAHRPSPTFLTIVAVATLVSDVSTKLWAERRLEAYPGYIKVLDDQLMFVLAKNKGGAWGLLQGQSENVRIPFFLLVSAAAIAFIVTLYRRLLPNQRALQWGLPLVLGGALGNVFDRIRYGYVIDFIDFRADWIRKLNELIAPKVTGHVVTDHWPTFNVADIAICVGVGLMAVDMFTSRRVRKPVVADVPIEPEASPAEPTAPTGSDASTALVDDARADETASVPARLDEPAPSTGSES